MHRLPIVAICCAFLYSNPLFAQDDANARKAAQEMTNKAMIDALAEKQKQDAIVAAQRKAEAEAKEKAREAEIRRLNQKLSTPSK